MSKKQKPTGNTGRKNQIKGKYAERSRKNGFRKILSDFAGYYECGIYGSTRTA